MVQILDLCVGAAVLSSLLSFKPFCEILYLLSFDLLMKVVNNVSNMFEKFPTFASADSLQVVFPCAINSRIKENLRLKDLYC